MDALSNFQEKLPHVREWIQGMVTKYGKEARPASSYSFPDFPLYFSEETLQAAKIVEVDSLPVPPLSSLGIPELADFEKDTKPYNGITLLDTCFIRKDAATRPELHFHEIVHVIQGRFLGLDNFLMAYGAGLLRFGYWNSPLEVMARKYTEIYLNNEPASNVEPLIGSEVEELSKTLLFR